MPVFQNQIFQCNTFQRPDIKLSDLNFGSQLMRQICRGYPGKNGLAERISDQESQCQ